MAFDRDSTPTSLSDRPLGGFPISIGTSYALESIFKPRLPLVDPSRSMPEHIEIDGYGEIWINIGTLLRNISQSVNSSVYIGTKEEHVIDILQQEIDVIKSIFSEEGKGVCTPIFYYCSYERLVKEMSRFVSTRVDSTELQKAITYKNHRTLLGIKAKKNGVRFLDHVLEPDNHSKASMILSHVAYDLTNYRNFNKLYLLESHTGVLKSRSMWNTKYAKISNLELNILPFTRKLLCIFGDSTFIQPMDIKFRKMILEIGHSHKWTALTTEEKIRFDLNLALKERYLFDVYNSL